jgi:glycosyltransferase involved in cell wall biosynthesis
MRIAHVTTVHRWDDGRIFERQARSLARAGHEVTVLAPGVERFWADGIEVVPLGLPRRRSDRMWRLVRAAGRILREQRPDVVIVHDPELLRLVVSTSFRRRRPSLIYDAHEDYSAQLRDKEWLPSWSRKLFSVVLGHAELLAARRAHVIFAATPSVAGRFPRSKTHVVLNRPVLEDLPDVDELPPGGDGPIDGATWTIVYVGDLRVVRGARTLIDALSMLPSDLSFRLRLVGRITPPSLEDELGRLPIWQKVEHLGWNSRQDVYDLVSSSDVAVLPFLFARNHVDSQPNKLFEYLTMGIPAVMSNFPAWVDLAQQVDARFVSFEAGNPAGLASALQQIFRDPGSGVRRTRSMRARELFGWESLERHYTCLVENA